MNLSWTAAKQSVRTRARRREMCADISQIDFSPIFDVRHKDAFMYSYEEKRLQCDRRDIREVVYVYLYSMYTRLYCWYGIWMWYLKRTRGGLFRVCS